VPTVRVPADRRPVPTVRGQAGERGAADHDGTAAWLAPGVTPRQAQLPAALWRLLPSDVAVGRPTAESYLAHSHPAALVALAVASVRRGRNLARLPRLD
jgi:hypothetical protein